MRLVCGGDSEIERGDACNCCRENKKREREKEKRKEERETEIDREIEREREQGSEPQATCNCAVQLWLVPFDKTDLAVKNGFDKGRISDYESISDTKASQFGVSSLSLFLIPSSRPSPSLISPFLSLAGLAICKSLSARKCFLSGSSAAGRHGTLRCVARERMEVTSFDSHNRMSCARTMQDKR